MSPANLVWTRRRQAAVSNNHLLRVAYDLMREPSAPRFADRAYFKVLYRDAYNAASGCASTIATSDSTHRRFIELLIDAKSVLRVQPNLYVNNMTTPAVHPNEAAAVLRKNAVISLGTVLGEVGVAHNPSRVVSAVLPASLARPRGPHTVVNPFGEYCFFVMCDDKAFAGDERDRLEVTSRYARATPERAFCDWVYFTTQVGPDRMSQPPLDFDLSDINHARLKRLTVAMGIAKEMKEWLSRKAKADADPEFSEKFSMKLGF